MVVGRGRVTVGWIGSGLVGVNQFGIWFFFFLDESNDFFASSPQKCNKNERERERERERRLFKVQRFKKTHGTRKKAN